MIGVCLCSCLIALTLTVTGAAQPNEWVRVPGGSLIHKSCLYPVENGFVVDKITPCPYRAQLTVPEDQLYNMDVHYMPSSELMMNMNASFTAPQLPAQDDGQVVYFWPGFKSDQPTMGLPVLQPVLQYGTDCCGGGNYWCVRSWFVYGNQGIAYYSPECPVSPGDKVNSWMSYDATAQMWTINAYNTKTMQNTTLFISHAGVVNTDFHVAMLVLESIMDQSQCVDLPASNAITFTGVSVNGKKITWTDRITDSSCGEKITDQSSTVTFAWQSA